MISSYTLIVVMRIFGNMSSFLGINVFLTVLLLSVIHGRFIDDRKLVTPGEEPNVELTIDEMINLASLSNTNTNGPDDVDDTEVRQEFDMILTRDQYEALHPVTTGNRQKRKAISSNLAQRWTDNQVWYRRQPGAFSQDQWDKILQAMREFEEKTCLKFHEDVDQSHYNHVYIVTGADRCSSHVGMQGGAQIMTLGASRCFIHGAILHEIGHAIGFMHEHNRPDRDDYIEILEENIIPGYSGMFKQYPSHWINYYNVPYDYSSVMHYSGHVASKSFDPTIRTKDRSKQYLIGQRKRLSFHDIQLANRMYECDAKCDDLNDACTAWVKSSPDLCHTNRDVIRLCPQSCYRCPVTSDKTTIMSSANTPTSTSTSNSTPTSTSSSTSTSTSTSTTTSTPTSTGTSNSTPTSTPSSTSTSTSTSTTTSTPTSTSTSNTTPTSIISSKSTSKSTSTPTSTSTSTSTRTSTNTKISTNTSTTTQTSSTPKTSNKPITSHTTLPTPGTTRTPCTDHTHFSRSCVHWARVPGICQIVNVRKVCKKSCGVCDA